MNFSVLPCVSRHQIFLSFIQSFILCYAKMKMPVLNMILIIFYLPTRKCLPFLLRVCVWVNFFFFVLAHVDNSFRSCKIVKCIANCLRLFCIFINFPILPCLSIDIDETQQHIFSMESQRFKWFYTPKNECFGDICVTFR